MSLDVETVMRVLDACDRMRPREPLVSFVFPRRGRGQGQMFLRWHAGWMLKDYIRDPALTNKLSLYTAAYSRIVDHTNIKRRLTYVPKPGDEIRFLRA